MTRSPRRFFFFLAILLAMAGYILGYFRIIFLSHPNNGNPPIQELTLARYYQETGQIDKAISEYKDVFDLNIADSIKTQAYKELKELLFKQDSGFVGNLESYGVYVIWYLIPKLYFLSGFFFLLWIVVLIIHPFIKKPELVIFPLYDFSGLNVGESLPQLASDRLRELKWRFGNLENTTLALSETLDVPLMGVMGDIDTIDVSAIIETALMFSGGPANLPLSRIFNSLRLWFDQPKYILHGSLETIDNNILQLHLVLINRDRQTVVKTWYVRLERHSSVDIIHQIVDSLIYPLMFHFSKINSSRQWESFKALCDGLENIELYKEKRYDITCLIKAKESLERAVEIDPNYNLAIYNLGLLLLRLGEYELAREKFREVSSSSSDSNLRQFSLYSYAVALFELSQDWSYNRAVEVLKKLITESENKEVLRKARGALSVTYARLAGRDKKLRDQFINLAFDQVREIKTDRAANKDVVATAMAAEGYVYIVLEQLDNAVSSFRQAVEIDEKNASCWIGLGDAYFRNNQKEDAISAFRRAADLSPSSGYSNYRLGNIYRDLSDLENAVEAYKRTPQTALAHLSLGKIYLGRQDYESALDEFRKAAEQNKRLVDAWVNIAWTICELNTIDEEMIREAETSAKRGLQLEQNQSQLWHRYAILSRVLLLANKKDKALNAAQEAIKLNPNQPQAYYYYALIEYDIGHFDRAVEFARKVIDLDQGEWSQKAEMLIKRYS